jgi:hypothetical protein
MSDWRVQDREFIEALFREPLPDTAQCCGYMCCDKCGENKDTCDCALQRYIDTVDRDVIAMYRKIRSDPFWEKTYHQYISEMCAKGKTVTYRTLLEYIINTGKLPRTEELPAAHTGIIAPSEELPAAHTGIIAPSEELPAAHTGIIAPSEELPSASTGILPPSEELPSADTGILPHSEELPSVDTPILPHSEEPQSSVNTGNPVQSSVDTEIPEEEKKSSVDTGNQLLSQEFSNTDEDIINFKYYGYIGAVVFAIIMIIIISFK